MPNLNNMMEFDWNITDFNSEHKNFTEKTMEDEIKIRRGEIERPEDSDRQINFQKLYDKGLISATTLLKEYPMCATEELKRKRDEELRKRESQSKEEKDKDLFKERQWVELYKRDKRGDLSRKKLLQEFPYLEGESNIIDEQGDQFWKITGQESWENGYVVTHITWPSDRPICMKDVEGDKPILVPTFDLRNITNSKEELIIMLIEDNQFQKVHGNLKYIYCFEVEGYQHLFGMVALSKESEPVTDFFKNIQPLQECVESQFKSY